jgi:hypothetical protein
MCETQMAFRDVIGHIMTFPYSRRGQDGTSSKSFRAEEGCVKNPVLFSRTELHFVSNNIFLQDPYTSIM